MRDGNSQDDYLAVEELHIGYGLVSWEGTSGSPEKGCKYYYPVLASIGRGASDSLKF